MSQVTEPTFKDVGGTEFPTPTTVDVLAEVSNARAGKRLGYLAAVPYGYAASISSARTFGRLDWERADLISLAAYCLARVELIDRGEVD